MSTIRFLAVAALLVARLSMPAVAGDEKIDANALGRSFTESFYAGRLDAIWDAFNKEMKSAMVSKENLTTFQGQALGQLGRETAIVAERVTPTGAYQTYVRHARFDKIPQLIEVVWSFDDKGAVAGFYIRPVQKEAESKHLDYKTKTELHLPFDGDWYVFWGGRTIADNYHAVAADQRFAYDILMMKDGASHTGAGTANEDYHCFGQPIMAPGDGVVAEAVDGIDDNKPGEMNAKQPVGNHVVIDHGNGEYSFIAHLKKGTVAARKGQSIKTGEALGLCGNSGNSSEPHLHYHLQTTPRFADGEGLPAQFRDYIADGKPVESGEPVKGQSIHRTADPKSK